MLKAITLMEYFRDHALVVMRHFAEVGALNTTALTGLRAKVHSAVKKDEPEWVTVGQIRRRAARSVTGDEFDAVLASLVKDSYLEVEDILTKSKGGRPSQKYRIPQPHPENMEKTATTPELNLNGLATTYGNNRQELATTSSDEDYDAPIAPGLEPPVPEEDLPWDTDEGVRL